MNQLKPYAKAVAGFLVAATGSLAVAAVDNSIVLGEWMAALATAVAAGAAVFGVRNTPADGRPPHVPEGPVEDVRPPPPDEPPDRDIERRPRRRRT